MRLNRAIASLALLAALGSTPALATELTNGRITVDFDTNPSFPAPDQDRVDSISWIQSDGTSTGNLAASSPFGECGDVSEFFGQSYDEGSVPDTPVQAIIAGSLSNWTDVDSGLSGYSKATQAKTCDRPLQAVTETYYKLKTLAAVSNALRIERRIRFLASAKGKMTNFRAYVARLPYPIYPTILVPETDGTIHRVSVTYGDLSGWNGTWFADDNGSGYGMMVIRDASSTWPATIDMDTDGGSNSNLAAISLIVPPGGFSGEITETEWLCFYDPTTWPKSRAAKGLLPKGCSVPVVTNR